MTKEAVPIELRFNGPARVVLPSLKVKVPWAFTGALLDAFTTRADTVADAAKAEGVGFTEGVVVVAGSEEVPKVRHQPLVISRVPAPEVLAQLMAKSCQVPVGLAPAKVLLKVEDPWVAGLL